MKKRCNRLKVAPMTSPLWVHGPICSFLNLSIVYSYMWLFLLFKATSKAVKAWMDFLIKHFSSEGFAKAMTTVLLEESKSIGNHRSPCRSGSSTNSVISLQNMD